MEEEEEEEEAAEKDDDESDDEWTPTQFGRGASPPPQTTGEEVVSVAEWVVQQRQAAGQRASQYVGVGWDSCKRRWVSDIFHDGCGHSLGEYLEEEAAARAFDEAARRLRGDKAHGGRDGIWRLNFPTEGDLN